MRPGQLSTKGFLGKDERLLDVLAQDNAFVVDELGATHQELARHLHVLGAIAVKQAVKQPKELVYHGKKLRVKATLFRGYAMSPFEDGTKTNCETTIENLETGQKVSYSLLVPHMIERYGFYEGKETPYRVEPRGPGGSKFSATARAPAGGDPALAERRPGFRSTQSREGKRQEKGHHRNERGEHSQPQLDGVSSGEGKSHRRCRYHLPGRRSQGAGLRA